MIRLINNSEFELISKDINYKISNNEFEKCYIYILNDKIIGLIDFSDIYDRFELNYIWINPQYRNMKYSHDLMDYLIKYGENKNMKNITLEVSTRNNIAINLYKTYGFTKVAIRKNYYNGIDGLLMIRKFDNNE